MKTIIRDNKFDKKADNNKKTIEKNIKSRTLSLRLANKTIESLDYLSDRLNVNRSEIMKRAFEEYIYMELQRQAVLEQGRADIVNGDVFSHQDVKIKLSNLVK